VEGEGRGIGSTESILGRTRRRRGGREKRGPLSLHHKKYACPQEGSDKKCVEIARRGDG